MNSQEKLQEALGLGKLADLPPWDRRTLDNWFYMYENREEDLLEIIDKVQAWYWGKTFNPITNEGEFPKKLSIYNSSVKKHFEEICKKESA